MTPIHVTAILENARQHQQYALSEYESKRILQVYGIPVVEEVLVQTWQEVRDAGTAVGYPLVLKVCSPDLTHKTEKGLIATNLRDERDLEQAFVELEGRAEGLKSSFLLQKMIQGPRELVMGMIRDPQFGPCVMFGLGGIYAEALGDVCFRVAPIRERDALEMMTEIKGHQLLGPFRGMEAVDADMLCKNLIALGQIGLEHESITSIDVNPMIVCGKKPIAVDALVVLKTDFS